MKSEEAQIKGPRLEKPVRITDQVWPEGTVPVVSVCCITYNHVNFIRDAVEGFLMQETTFPVEIIIRDDASTDGTAEIVREYQEKFPHLIRTILHSENQYSQGKKAFPETYAKSRGEFIAICEGDDYWICKEKLQKQVELMLNNSDCVLCGARCYVTEEPSRTPYRIEPDLPSSVVAHLRAEEYLFSRGFFRVPTRLVRTIILKQYVEWAKNVKVGTGDWSMFLYCAVRSLGVPQGIMFIDEPFAVYREHKGGVWTPLADYQKNSLAYEDLQCIISLVEDIHLKLQLLEVKRKLARYLAMSPGVEAERRKAYCWEALHENWLDAAIWKSFLAALKKQFLGSAKWARVRNSKLMSFIMGSASMGAG